MFYARKKIRLQVPLSDYKVIGQASPLVNTDGKINAANCKDLFFQIRNSIRAVQQGCINFHPNQNFNEFIAPTNKKPRWLKRGFLCIFLRILA